MPFEVAFCATLVGLGGGRNNTLCAWQLAQSVVQDLHTTLVIAAAGTPALQPMLSQVVAIGFGALLLPGSTQELLLSTQSRLSNLVTVLITEIASEAIVTAEESIQSV